MRKKNRTALSPDVYVHDFERLVIQRIRPARGFYHALTPSDIRRFVGLIPDWDSVSSGLKAVILTPGDDWCYGRYNNAGVVTLDAWPKDEATYWPCRKDWLLRRIGVDAGNADTRRRVLLNREQVRCMLLLGTFLHELGHHVDRMTTRSRQDAANGEPVAIAYELRRQQELWPAFAQEFGCPSS